MVKNVVLIRIISTMTEFKQNWAQYLRDYDKLYFYSRLHRPATRPLRDKGCDDPEFVSEEEIDGDGSTDDTSLRYRVDNTDQVGIVTTTGHHRSRAAHHHRFTRTAAEHANFTLKGR
jgi:hypothetical protein